MGLLQEQNHSISLDDLQRLRGERSVHQQIYNDMWRENRLDVILAPVSSHTSLPHDQSKHLSYTVLWNYLDHPSISIPCGTVKNTDSVGGAAKYGAIDEEVYASCELASIAS